MALYGLYVRELSKSDLVWFKTDQSLEAGRYRIGLRHESANVFLAKSIPALILKVGPIIDRAEALAQSSLSPQGTPEQVERKMAADMTHGLLERLNETSSIWESNPHWLKNLRPCPEPAE